MGVYEENEVPECNVMMGKDKPDNPAFLLKKLPTSFKKNKAERILIAGQTLVIIGLFVALITVTTVSSRSTTCDKNNEDRAYSPSIAPEIKEVKYQKSAPCEDDWIWHRGKCYYFSTEIDTWRNSEKFCHSHNSSLAIIDNKEELDFLSRHKDTYNHWIGLRRTEDNTGWIWTNGESYNESLFKIIRSSQEDIDFVYLNSKHVGSDGGNFEFKWICSKT